MRKTYYTTDTVQTKKNIFINNCSVCPNKMIFISNRAEKVGENNGDE